MLDRLTLTLSAMALSKECRRASEAQDLNRLIDHADALRAVAHALRTEEWPDRDQPGNIQPPIRIAPWQLEGVA